MTKRKKHLRVFDGFGRSSAFTPPSTPRCSGAAQRGPRRDHGRYQPGREHRKQQQPAAAHVSGSRRAALDRRRARPRRARTPRRPPARSEQHQRSRAGRSRTGAGGRSRPRAAAPARGAARARCAAAPPRARPCRPAARARRASGTSRGRCSRRHGTRPAARPSASRRRRGRPAASRSSRSTRGRDPPGRRRAGTGSPAARETARKLASDMSSSPWKTLSASAATSRSRIGVSAVRQQDLVADALVQHVGHRVRVGDDRHGVSSGNGCDSSSQGLARSASVAASERWNANRPGTDESPADAEDARAGRLVQIQAARVVARAERETARSSRFGNVGQAERVAAVALLGSCASGTSRSTSSA